MSSSSDWSFRFHDDSSQEEEIITSNTTRTAHSIPIKQLTEEERLIAEAEVQDDSDIEQNKLRVVGEEEDDTIDIGKVKEWDIKISDNPFTKAKMFARMKKRSQLFDDEEEEEEIKHKKKSSVIPKPQTPSKQKSIEVPLNPIQKGFALQTKFYPSRSHTAPTKKIKTSHPTSSTTISNSPAPRTPNKLQINIKNDLQTPNKDQNPLPPHYNITSKPSPFLTAPSLYSSSNNQQRLPDSSPTPIPIKQISRIPIPNPTTSNSSPTSQIRPSPSYIRPKNALEQAKSSTIVKQHRKIISPVQIKSLLPQTASNSNSIANSKSYIPVSHFIPSTFTPATPFTSSSSIKTSSTKSSSSPSTSSSTSTNKNTPKFTLPSLNPSIQVLKSKTLFKPIESLQDFKKRKEIEKLTFIEEDEEEHVKGEGGIEKIVFGTGIRSIKSDSSSRRAMKIFEDRAGEKRVEGGHGGGKSSSVYGNSFNW